MGSVMSSAVCDIVGMAFPIWASYKAIESPQPDDDTQWLTYWVIFAIFSFFENFSDFIIGWFPLYYTFKFFIMVLLQLPQLRIPSYLYVVHVRPRLKLEETQIDQFLADTTKSLKRKTVSMVTSQFSRGGSSDIQTTVATALVEQVIEQQIHHEDSKTPVVHEVHEIHHEEITNETKED